MWKVKTSDEYDRRAKEWSKKRPRELMAVQDNLGRYLKALTAGKNPAQIREGFIHVEPQGVYALDQKGGGSSLAQTRLYVWAHIRSQTLVLLTLGDKRTQRNDVKFCSDSAKSLSIEAEHWSRDDVEVETDDLRES